MKTGADIAVPVGTCSRCTTDEIQFNERNVDVTEFNE